MDAIAGFQHAVLPYTSASEYLNRARAFLGEGLAAGEPVLVAVPPTPLERLRAAAAGSELAMFANMLELGRNPSRIIPAIHRFRNAHPPDTGLRALCEPSWEERSAMEHSEVTRHEALLNLAFAAHPLRLLCAYDAARLPKAVVDDAMRTHPGIHRDGIHRDNEHYVEPQRLLDPGARPLEPPPAGAQITEITLSRLPIVRRTVAISAQRAGITADRINDLMIAINELASNVIRHGGGRGHLAIWTDQSFFVCQVADEGYIADPLIGRRPPDLQDDAGRGLWMVNELCDLVELRSSPAGTTVRVRMQVPKPGRAVGGAKTTL